jgi:hypothetical protein
MAATNYRRSPSYGFPLPLPLLVQVQHPIHNHRPSRIQPPEHMHPIPLHPTIRPPQPKNMSALSLALPIVQLAHPLFALFALPHQHHIPRGARGCARGDPESGLHSADNRCLCIFECHEGRGDFQCGAMLLACDRSVSSPFTTLAGTRSASCCGVR